MCADYFIKPCPSALLSARSWQCKIRTSAAHSAIPARRRRAAPVARQHKNMNLGFANRLKTWILLALLGAIFVAVGGVLGGRTGLVFAFGFALLLNGVVYWTSDTLALKANGARPLGPNETPRLR
jgi:Zn-dependent protease with chaperone function